MYRGFYASRFAQVVACSCLLVADFAWAAEPKSGAASTAVSTSLTDIDADLAKPTSFDFLMTPLRDVLAVVADVSGVPVTANVHALSDAGFDLDDAVVSLDVNGVPLASNLDAICDLLDLEWIVRDDTIEFTTHEAADDDDQIAWTVNVTDLSRDAEWLVDFITAAVSPETWSCNGGMGAILTDETRDTSAIIVQNSFTVLRHIAGLLGCIRRIAAMPEGGSTPLAADGYWSDATSAVAARKALATPMTVNLKEASLREAVVQISDLAGVPISLDWPALEAAGIDADGFVVTFSAKKTQLSKLLDRMLKPHGLTWDIRYERLLITTIDMATERMSVAVYPISHLLAKARDPEKLIDTVQSAVTPDAWERVGGMAFLKEFQHHLASAPRMIVIRHSAAGHSAVHAFLRKLPE